MFLLYSPLEQFEPVPFIMPLFFGGFINLSVTNVIFMMFYVFFAIGFLVRGFLFSFDVNENNSFIKVNLLEGSKFLKNAKKVFLFDKNIVLTSFFYNNLNSFRDSLNNFKKLNVLISSNSIFLSFAKDNRSLSWFGYKNVINKYFLLNKFYFYLFVFYRNLLTRGAFDGYVLSFLDNYKLKSNDFSFAFKNFYYTKVSKNFISRLHVLAFENLYNTFVSMVKDSIEVQKSIRFFPIIFLLFLFIIFCNVLGLIPYSSTVTSYISVTFTLTLIVLFATNLMMMQKYGHKMLGAFLPAGTPLALYPVLIPIETISYFIRLVSLSVRLFANMMAGHTLLVVLAGFGWMMMIGGIYLFSVYWVPLFIVFCLVGLETMVAFIQAYVFAILCCIYINDAHNMH